MKLQKLSLFGAVAGALILTGVLAPRANANCLTCPVGETVKDTPLVYFNFETATGFTSVSPFDGYTQLQSSTIVNGPTNPFPTATMGPVKGHFSVTGTWVDQSHNTNVSGTTMNQLANDTTTSDPNHALDLGGNTTPSQPMFCFTFTVNTQNTTNLCLSFALKSVGNGSFATVAVDTTPGGASPDNSALNIIQDGAYHTYNFDISGAAGSASATIEICLSDSPNSNQANHTFIDNIQVNSEKCVPEPSTYIGGLLGIVALCWYQRRGLTRFLRLRRA